MRKAVTFLQSCARVCGEGTIDENTVLEVAGVRLSIFKIIFYSLFFSILTLKKI